MAKIIGSPLLLGERTDTSGTPPTDDEGETDQIVPTEYSLIDTCTTSQTWVAPEDGYFQVEVFGASGSGGTAVRVARNNLVGRYNLATGGGGGSGAYVLSDFIKLNKDDTIAIAYDDSGNITVTINSSTGETYETMTATSGQDGGDGAASEINSNDSENYAGAGGAGGTASGGNAINTNGNAGSDGERIVGDDGTGSVSGGTGGSAVNGGNAGGTGGGASPSGTSNPTTGEAGFVKIYRGNTNIAS